jgi:hypothetical protein
VREEGKGQQSVPRIEILKTAEQRLVVAGADSNSAAELGCYCGSDFFHGDCLGVIEHTIALEANIEGNLEILNNRLLAGTKERASHCQKCAITS